MQFAKYSEQTIELSTTYSPTFTTPHLVGRSETKNRNRGGDGVGSWLVLVVTARSVIYCSREELGDMFC